MTDAVSQVEPKLIRLRVNLLVSTSEELRNVMEMTGLNATDSVNAAIQTYHILVTEHKKHRTIHIRSRFGRWINEIVLPGNDK